MSVVDGAAHTQKDDGENKRRLLGECCRGLVLLLCGVQPVLRSGVLTILDIDRVDVTPSLVEVVRSVLSGVGGSTGGWRCCWDAPSQLPPATTKSPPPYISLLFLCFCSDGSNQHKIWAAEVNLSLSGKRDGKSHLGTILLSAFSGILRFCMVIIRSLLPISMENA